MTEPAYVEDFIWEVAEAELDPVQAANAWARGLRKAGATRVKKAYIGGVALPLVVEFDCPFWHDPEIAGTVPKVRLLVRRDGWVGFYRGMDGKPGSESCRVCRSELHLARWLILCPLCDRAEHAEHDKGAGPDQSPHAHVIREISSGEIAEAEDDKIDGIDTIEEAVAWLDSLTVGDGAPLVSESAGQQAAWEAVKNHPGCPTQTLVRKAQAERKARG